MSDRVNRLRDATIQDFGEQWIRYRESDGYYGSVALLEDILAPALGAADVRGRRVAEIGSGTGRIVRMLLEVGVGHVVAVEPSAAFAVLRDATSPWANRVTLLNVTGEHLPPTSDCDLVVCIGVLHHIPDPRPVVHAAHAALKPGGRLFVWLYGKEGNRFYLALVQPLRSMTTRLPHAVLVAVTRLLDLALVAYMALARVLPLPLRQYLREVVARLGPAERRLVIYDQLNPRYAKYYTRDEARRLLEDAGFGDVQLFHRHGYSWSVIGARSGLGDGRS